MTGKLCRKLGEELTQLCRGLELRDWIQPLEGTRESVGKAPHGSRREFRILRLEVVMMYLRQQSPRRIKFSLHECGIEDQLRLIVADLRAAPAFNLPLHRLEVSLDAVHPYGQCVDQVEAFAVLGQDRRELAAERHVRAHEDSYADRESKPQRLVVRISDADGKSASLHLRFQVKHAEHLHAVKGDGIFFIHHADMSKAESLDQRFDNLVVRDWFMG